MDCYLDGISFFCFHVCLFYTFLNSFDFTFSFFGTPVLLKLFHFSVISVFSKLPYYCRCFLLFLLFLNLNVKLV
ncbi:hypothetical protein HanXRQr2_Chr17g0798451 [Helianthus annuus]|uniref:Uncharacterized protein n=1 Tax=Helianthus annuus TaxID=4232 RepID=A0A9K3DGR0_HELAN|nr:hypothetical protein HanXRQr2_Chr17g0798451 [Helianthus annuus]